MGVVPYDENIRKAVRKQKAIVEAFPDSPASKAFKNLAKKIIKWPIPHRASGHLEFFIEQLLDN